MLRLSVEVWLGPKRHVIARKWEKIARVKFAGMQIANSPDIELCQALTSIYHIHGSTIHEAVHYGIK